MRGVFSMRGECFPSLSNFTAPLTGAFFIPNICVYLMREVPYEAQRTAGRRGRRQGVRGRRFRGLVLQNTFGRGARRRPVFLHEREARRRQRPSCGGECEFRRRHRKGAVDGMCLRPRPRRAQSLRADVRGVLGTPRGGDEGRRRGGHQRKDVHRALYRVDPDLCRVFGGDRRHGRALYLRRESGGEPDHSRQFRACRAALQDEDARRRRRGGGGLRPRDRAGKDCWHQGGYRRLHQSHAGSSGLLRHLRGI